MAKIDVIMGVYNGSDGMRGAVGSILDQSLSDIRLLIMDDGSTDDTGDILQQIARDDERVVLFSQENAGLGRALNSLIGYCEAPYIARMDADDISLPGRLEAQYDYMERNRHIGMAATWSALEQHGQQQMGCQCYPDDHAWLTRQLEAGRNVFVHSSVIMRKDTINAFAEPYRFRLVQDYDLWLRISEVAGVGMVEDVLHVSCFHGGRVSGRGVAYRRELHNAIRRLGRERRSGRSEAMTTAELERQLAKRCEALEDVSLDADWYRAMNAVFRRDHALARRHFLKTLKNNRSMRARAAKWLVATSLPGGHRLLSRLYDPLGYVKPLEDVVDAAACGRIRETIERHRHDDRGGPRGTTGES